MTPYSEDDMLMLSGIQHIAFCERQWALIHMEQLWTDNHLTVEGSWMHRRADDAEANESRGDVVSLHAVSLASNQLGIYGIADIVELHRSPDDDINAVTHPLYEGRWYLVPVEYKHGKPKEDFIDEVQLCAQAICLEEMYGVCILKGYIYYGETKHRIRVEFNRALRERTSQLVARMHQLYDAKQIPVPQYRKACRSCSLIDICQPKTFASVSSVNSYLSQLNQ